MPSRLRRKGGAILSPPKHCALHRTHLHREAAAAAVAIQSSVSDSNDGIPDRFPAL